MHDVKAVEMADTVARTLFQRHTVESTTCGNLEVATATEDHAGFHFCQPRTGSQRVDRRRLEKKHEIKVLKANIDGYYKFSEISFSKGCL